MASKTWKVGFITLQRKPHGWHKLDQHERSKEEVFIDILRPIEDRRCYRVIAYKPNQYFPKERKILGEGCARKPSESWKGALENSTKIAKKYMGHQ